MAPIFASPDIAAIVATFPPPLPTRERPSLVRGTLGEQLLDSRKILVKLGQILETSSSRIPISQLPSLLGVNSADWLFGCYRGSLSYSRDRLELVPVAELRQILDKANHGAQQDFVDISTWANKYDIDQASLNKAIDDGLLRDAGRQLETHLDSTNKKYISQPGLYTKTANEIQAAVQLSSQEPCDISARCPNVPAGILRMITEDLIRSQAVKGSLKPNTDGVILVPDDHQASLQRKAEEDLQMRLNEVFSAIESEGFQQFSKDSAGDKLRRAADEKLQQPDFKGKAATLELDDGSWLIAPQKDLDQTLQALTSNAKQQMSSLWKQNKTEMPSTISDDKILTGHSQKQGLAPLVLRSNLRKEVHAGIAVAVSDLAAADRKRFVLSIQERILSPTQLYIKGFETIADDSLRARLESVVTDHLRTEVATPAIQTIRSEGLLRDKARSRDVEKFGVGINACITLADVSGAVTKLCRKQKFEEPDSAAIREAKLQILQSKTKALKRMTRGSDVLQNAIWIALARAADTQGIDALFVSSGKDTSKMIKAYQNFGNSEVGQKLESLRDSLKAGQESGVEVKRVKEMAEAALQGMLNQTGS